MTVRAMRDDMTKDLAPFLHKLWDQIVSPIVDCLQATHPPQSESHIRWCPTADFSVLPLHAAGPYRKGQQNLPDFYILSYTVTSTLTALIRSRRRNSATEQKRFIAIGQAIAAGESELVSVGAELDNIRQRVDGLATPTRTWRSTRTPRTAEEPGKMNGSTLRAMASQIGHSHSSPLSLPTIGTLLQPNGSSGVNSRTLNLRISQHVILLSEMRKARTRSIWRRRSFLGSVR